MGISYPFLYHLTLDKNFDHCLLGKQCVVPELRLLDFFTTVNMCMDKSWNTGVPKLVETLVLLIVHFCVLQPCQLGTSDLFEIWVQLTARLGRDPPFPVLNQGCPCVLVGLQITSSCSHFLPEHLFGWRCWRDASLLCVTEQTLVLHILFCTFKINLTPVWLKTS